MFRKGFTLIEIVIVISILGLLLTLAMPGLFRARVNANHSRIQTDLRTFSTANEMYRAHQNPPTYAPDIPTLTGGGPPYLDTTWDAAVGAQGKHSYSFVYTLDATGTTYSMLATPMNVNGINTYCVDQSVVIVGGSAGGAPTGDATGCQGGTPLS